MGSFNPLTYVENALGFRFLEDAFVDRIKQKYPQYNLSDSERAHANKMCTDRATLTSLGLGCGACIGFMLTATVLKKRTTVAKIATNIALQNVGFIFGSYYGVVESFDSWITFDNSAKFNSWTQECIVETESDPKEVSFMAEYFRRSKLSFAPAFADVLNPLCVSDEALDAIYAKMISEKE